MRLAADRGDIATRHRDLNRLRNAVKAYRRPGVAE
jgi:hypothetical protein